MVAEDQGLGETWATVMGVQIVSATASEVVLDLEIGPKHRQKLGMVHGGVYCGLIESAASIGANIVTAARGQKPALGLENHTSFVRGAREGRLRVVATPITAGRTTQVWEATVKDASGQTLATGRVRLLCGVEMQPADPGKAGP